MASPLNRTGLIVILALVSLGATLRATAQTSGRPAKSSDAPAAAPSQESPAQPAPKGSAADDSSLSAEQAKLAVKYKELERVILRMAEVMQSSDPKRAALLKQAYAQSKQRQVDLQYEDLVKLLQQEQLYQASKGQVAVQQDLNQLLQLLLSGEREKQIPSERAEIKRFIERINKLIREEQGLQGETEGQGDSDELAKRQQSVADKTAELNRDLHNFDGRDKPSGDTKDNPGDKDAQNDGGEKPADGKPGDKRDAEKANGKDGDKNAEGNDASGKDADGKNADGKETDKSQDGKSDGKGSEKSDGKSDQKSDQKSDSKSDSKAPDKSDASKSDTNKSDDQRSGNKSDADKDTDQKSDDQKSDDGKSNGKKSDDQKSDGSKSRSQKSDKSEGKSGSKSGQKSEGKSQSGGKPQQDKSPSKSQNGKPQDGKPSDGQPNDSQSDQDSQSGKSAPQQSGSDESPARKRVRQAEERMRAAKRQLEEAQRRGAAEEQERAVEELKQAKAELEEILRQLREEEIERVLAQLESRFRKMLQLQIEVYEGTIGLDRIPEEDRDRDVEIESGKLSRKEAEIGADAEKTLALLREEGSSVAFPESVEQMHEDMQQIAVRLGRANVGQITQGIEQDVVKALEEMIASLQKAQKEQKQRRGGGGGGGGGGGRQEQPLVGAIAELKMIRALQMRANTRTERYSKLLQDGTEQAEAPDLLDAVKRLSEREQRIYRTTRDIVVGKNN